jgi:hypothetical protein
MGRWRSPVSKRPVGRGCRAVTTTSIEREQRRHELPLLPILYRHGTQSPLVYSGLRTRSSCASNSGTRILDEGRRRMKMRPAMLGGAIGAILTSGIAFGVNVEATTTNPTYYACLASGKLTKVGTTSSTCAAPAKAISWNSQGPAGAAGGQGPAGPSGLTNFELAQENGYQGSLTQWLSSLIGPQGPTGSTGQTGATGPTGAQGPIGATGATGPAGPVGATGSPGPQGPAGISGVYQKQGQSAPLNVEYTYVTLAPLNLPAGDYALSANVSVSQSIPGVDQCTIAESGSTLTYQNIDPYTANNAGVEAALSMSATVALTAATSISLNCTTAYSNSTSTQSGSSTLTAVTVGSINNS